MVWEEGYGIRRMSTTGEKQWPVGKGGRMEGGKTGRAVDVTESRPGEDLYRAHYPLA